MWKRDGALQSSVQDTLEQALNKRLQVDVRTQVVQALPICRGNSPPL